VPRPGSQFILSSTRAQHLRCAYFSFGFFKKNAQDLRKWVREKDDDDLKIIKIKKNPCITPPNKTNSTNEINLSRRVFSLPSMAQSNNREHQIRDVVFYLYFALDSSATPEAIEPLAWTAAAARSRISEKKEKRIEKINVRRAATPPIV
jgi:hypothetical protein